jgi:hypothetical protein
VSCCSADLLCSPCVARCSASGPSGARSSGSASASARKSVVFTAKSQSESSVARSSARDPQGERLQARDADGEAQAQRVSHPWSRPAPLLMEASLVLLHSRRNALLGSFDIVRPCRRLHARTKANLAHRNLDMSPRDWRYPRRFQWKQWSPTPVSSMATNHAAPYDAATSKKMQTAAILRRRSGRKAASATAEAPLARSAAVVASHAVPSLQLSRIATVPRRAAAETRSSTTDLPIATMWRA